MSELIEFEDEILEEDNRDMPSKKHSRTKTNLTVLFGNDNRFTTFVELSLDATSIDLSQFGLKAKDELIPDVCVYIEPPPEQVDWRVSKHLQKGLSLPFLFFDNRARL